MYVCMYTYIYIYIYTKPCDPSCLLQHSWQNYDTPETRNMKSHRKSIGSPLDIQWTSNGNHTTGSPMKPHHTTGSPLDNSSDNPLRKGPSFG